MNKIFLTVMAGIVLAVSACNTKVEADVSDSNSTKEKNIAAANTIMNAFNSGDTMGLANVISDDFIDHTDRGDIKGSDSLKAMIAFVKANFKDMKSEKVHEVADDDYVYSWMRYTGTSDGSMGMPNGPYEMSSVEVSKFKDGKAIEHWAFMDARDVAKMMAPAGPAMGDGTKGK